MDNHLKAILISAFVFFSLSTEAQEISNELLDAALINGESALHREFGINLQYPPEALRNGVMGLSVFTFKVNCNNEVIDLKFETSLGHSIEEAIRQFLKSAPLGWKPCSERSVDQQMRVKLAFGLNNLYSPEGADFLINALVGNTEILSDKELEKKLTKALKKNKLEEASNYLSTLLLRYPYESKYLKLKNELKE